MVNLECESCSPEFVTGACQVIAVVFWRGPGEAKINCGGQVRGSLLSLEFIYPYVVIPSLRILYEALLIVAAVGIQWVYALGDDIDIGNTRPPIDNTCV